MLSSESHLDTVPGPALYAAIAAFGFPKILVTGVLGPGANAHGPDEMLDLAYVEKLTAGIARVLNAIP